MRRASLDVDDNTSPWVDGLGPDQPCDPLQGEITADVAVIGGGFCGLSTALHLSRRAPSLGIAVLEAKSLGNGASGRNGGLVLNWINGIKDPDDEATRRHFALTLDGIDGIERVIAEEGLDVPFAREGALDVFTDARRAEAAEARCRWLASLGLPHRWIPGAELRAAWPMEGAHGAMLDPTAGRLNGAAFCRALRPRLVARGVRVFEGSPVLAVEEGETISLHTAGGVVRCKRIVLATNGYTPRLGYFRSSLFPLFSHVVAAESAPAGGVAGFCDDLDRIAYGARLFDGKLLFGGGGNYAYAYRFGGRSAYDAPPSRYAGTERKMRTYFPSTGEVTHRWTGTLGVTMSRAPSIGVRGRWQNVFFAVGFCGHGVTMANVAGRVLADVLAGEGERWKDAPFFNRRLGYIPPEPFRWLGYHAFTSVTGRSPRRAD